MMMRDGGLGGAFEQASSGLWEPANKEPPFTTSTASTADSQWSPPKDNTGWQAKYSARTEPPHVSPDWQKADPGALVHLRLCGMKVCQRTWDDVERGIITFVDPVIPVGSTIHAYFPKAIATIKGLPVFIDEEVPYKEIWKLYGTR